MKKVFLMLSCCLGLAAANAQTATFNYTGAIVNWTVPCGVTQVTISATGATGGALTTYTAVVGGKGAKMVGTFTVVPASTLKILVGQAGGTATATNGGGGGGGGTFVTTSTNSPLIIAGGGGGTEPGSNAYVNVGIDAVTANTGVNGYSALGGSPNNYGVGGVGGDGATNNGANSPCAGNGGGLLTNGATPTCCTGTSGFAFVNGGAGGAACVGASGNGGFGGGGGGGNTGGGGGGGYGGGGGSWNTPVNGGGGGSYNIGSNQTNTAAFNAGGNGQVVITWVTASVMASVVSNVSCNGGSNGSALGTATGGSTPYTYLWTPSSQTNATATGLTAGTYTIKVTDACGNTATASVALTQPATAVVVTATTTTNVHCNGSNTGATGSTVTGGSSPYTYSWTGGSTSATATGLTAGTYTLTVHDANGCTGTASTVVTQPAALAISDTVTNVLCNGGSTGSASSRITGGVSPYTYLWEPGSSTTANVTGLSAGTYTLGVQDANGCTGTATATITQPTAISITSHSAPDNGHGVGTAVVSVSGGVGPYTYLWTGGKTTDSIGGLTKGTYCVDVKDANGCKDSLCVVVKSTAGIDGITSGSAQISVYPNPNNGQFTIESSIGGASTVEIYNILGEKVFTRNLSTTKGINTISVNQPNGVYLYRIISDNGNLLGEGRISIQK